jgi:formiminoglutamase
VNAGEWLAAGTGTIADVALLGAPISKASLTPSDAWSTPPAFRDALARFYTWDASHGVDLSTLRLRDLGDVEGDHGEPDASAAHHRVRDAVADASAVAPMIVVIGGDNSLTRPAMQGMMRSVDDRAWGLLTFDAHHDCRPADTGSRNGTPVRELIEGGLSGARVAQVGIHPFGNAAEQAQWAAAQGVHAYSLDEVRRAGIAPVVALALDALRRAGVTAVYVDVDVDVVDRAFAPACPASLPGGLTPYELLRGVERAVSDDRVRAVDLTEVDAKADVAAITLRLMAAVFLTLCSSIARRRPGATAP